MSVHASVPYPNPCRAYERQKPAEEFDRFMATVFNQVFVAAGIAEKDDMAYLDD